MSNRKKSLKIPKGQSELTDFTSQNETIELKTISERVNKYIIYGFHEMDSFIVVCFKSFYHRRKHIYCTTIKIL